MSRASAQGAAEKTAPVHRRFAARLTLGTDAVDVVAALAGTKRLRRRRRPKMLGGIDGWLEEGHHLEAAG
jgi:hypothetical protein